MDQIPRMIKSLALKAEAFNSYCIGQSLVRDVEKEVCFDMQVQLAEFFTNAIRYIRSAGAIGHSNPVKIFLDSPK